MHVNLRSIGGYKEAVLVIEMACLGWRGRVFEFVLVFDLLFWVGEVFVLCFMN
jgi:hypothetical protein